MKIHGQEPEGLSDLVFSLVSSKTRLARALQSLHHSTSHCIAYIYTYTCIMFKILLGYRSLILQHQNKRSRPFLFKNRIYPRIQLNMKAFSKKVTFKNLLNQTSQARYSLFLKSNSLNQIQPMFS